MHNDRSYFMRRAAQERSAALQAPDKRARAAHEALAERYRELAQAAVTPIRPSMTAE
jgi:hypothetical protein